MYLSKTVDKIVNLYEIQIRTLNQYISKLEKELEREKQRADYSVDRLLKTVNVNPITPSVTKREEVKKVLKEASMAFSNVGQDLPLEEDRKLNSGSNSDNDDF